MNVPAPVVVQVPCVALPVIRPSSITLSVLAQIIWSGPASAVAFGRIVTVSWSITALQRPLLVLVSVRSTVPLSESSELAR